MCVCTKMSAAVDQGGRQIWAGDITTRIKASPPLSSDMLSGSNNIYCLLYIIAALGTKHHG